MQFLFSNSKRLPLGVLAIFCSTFSMSTIAEPSANLGSGPTPVEFALQALKEACAPYSLIANQSLEATNLALYCLSTGENIVLQAAKNSTEKQSAQRIISRWIEDLQPAVAQYQTVKR